MQIYDWFKLFNLTDFLATGLVSRETLYRFEVYGDKTILVARGNTNTISFDDGEVIIPIPTEIGQSNVRGIYAVYLDANNLVWLGFATEVDPPEPPADVPSAPTNVVWLRGPAGANGFQGSTGPQGAGYQGATGSQGAIGQQGYQGSQGEIGAQGSQGPTGAQGDDGTDGADGAQGLTGAQGSIGFTGMTGAQGNQGHQGNNGSQGLSGNQGLTGAQGSQGDAGNNGSQGMRGYQGYQGYQGDAGAQGAAGTGGGAGSQGSQGYQGHQGNQGSTGSGSQGAQGASWYADVNYLLLWADGNATPVTDVLFSPVSPPVNSSSWHYTNDLIISQVATDYMRGAIFYEIESTGGTPGSTSGSNLVQSPLFALRTPDVDAPVGIAFDVLGVTNLDEWDIVVVRYDNTLTFVELLAVTGQNSASSCANTPSQSMTEPFFRGTFQSSTDPTDLYSVRFRRLQGSSATLSIDNLFMGSAEYVPGPGPQGAQGAQGTAGSNGSNGAQGAQGTAGIRAKTEYIANGDFEGNVTTGWATYADAAGTTPVDGTGGSASSTFTTTATDPLRGVYSGLWTKSANNRQGEGVSYDFTIDAADVSRPLQILVECLPGGSYVAGDMGFYIVADTAGTPTVVSPSIVDIPLGASKFIANFNATTATTYRLCMHTKTTSALAYTMKIDAASLGPNILAVGPVQSDWESFPAANTNIPVSGTSKFMYRRNNDNMEILVTFSSDLSSSTTEAYLDIPGSNNADTSKIQSSLGNGLRVGYLSWTDSAGGISPVEIAVVLKSGSTTRLGFTKGSLAGLLAQIGQIANASYNRSITITASIPISQWAGSGNIVSGPNLEFAADDGSNDVFGPEGALVPNVGYGANTTARSFSFQGNPGDTDQFVFEYKPNGYQWQALNNFHGFSGGNNATSSNFYGCRAYWTSATVFAAEFGNRGTRVSASNVDNGSEPWSTRYSAGDRFRCRRASGVASTALAEAVPGKSNGFLGFNGVKGRNDGAASPSGYVGEKIAGTWQSPAIGTNGSYTSTFKLTLNKGIYQLYGQVGITLGGSVVWAADPYIGAMLATTPGTPIYANYIQGNISAIVVRFAQISGHFVVAADNTDVYLQGRHNMTTTTGATYENDSTRDFLYAVRLA
jgi:hypothetical protein